MAHGTPLDPRVLDAVERVSTELRALVSVLQETLQCAETVAVVEGAGRLMDAARVHAAAALARDPLAAEQLGYPAAVPAVASLAQVSERTARERLRIAGAVTPDLSISGAPLPPARPWLADALASGSIGVDAAAVVARELDSVAPRVPAETLGATERVMVTLASGVDPTGQRALAPVSVDYLTTELRQIGSAVDPDGALPREQRAARRRGFRVGKQDDDGLFPVSGGLLPEIGILLLGLLEADRRSPKFVDAAQLELASDDSRTPDQRRHDALAEIVLAAAASDGTPQLDGAPVDVIVMVEQEKLDEADGLDGDPIGTMVGSNVPVSRAQVQRFMDAGGYRTMVIGAAGRVVSLSTIQRCFSKTQRISIGARDGYQCSRPGCTSPHYMLQAHHVIPDRDDGPTHVDNGILLCYDCHRRVDNGAWQYQMVRGVPYVRGPAIPEWRRLRGAMGRVA